MNILSGSQVKSSTLLPWETSILCFLAGPSVLLDSALLRFKSWPDSSSSCRIFFFVQLPTLDNPRISFWTLCAIVTMIIKWSLLVIKSLEEEAIHFEGSETRQNLTFG